MGAEARELMSLTLGSKWQTRRAVYLHRVDDTHLLLRPALALCEFLEGSTVLTRRAPIHFLPVEAARGGQHGLARDATATQDESN